MTLFLLDTDTASRLIRADSATVRSMRRSSAVGLGISTITQSELLYGARLRPEAPDLMTAVRTFLARINVHPWDKDAAELHALTRARLKAAGRNAGAFDVMIAAHARALSATLVTSDAAIHNLNIEGLTVVDWSV